VAIIAPSSPRSQHGPLRLFGKQRILIQIHDPQSGPHGNGSDYTVFSTILSSYLFTSRSVVKVRVLYPYHSNCHSYYFVNNLATYISRISQWCRRSAWFAGRVAGLSILLFGTMEYATELMRYARTFNGLTKVASIWESAESS